MYGADVDAIRDLCEFWRDAYDWRWHEARLNTVPGFLCEVDGVDLHFWRLTRPGRDRLPLLLLHGWPGSMVEFFELLGPLSEDFDLVVPSLPGFGFGGKPRERGWGPARIAAAMDALMARLGYERYGVQGGDWGAIIAARLGADHADRVAAIHVNMLVAPPPERPAPEDAEAVAHWRYWRSLQDAYARLQRTKPDSVTVAQSDSPAGLAAWIVEKFRTWSDCDGHPENVFTRDQLLTNVTIYWVTQTITSSARLYWENQHVRSKEGAGRRVEVPTGVACYPKEVVRFPRAWVERRYNVTYWNDMPRGGHFAAMEEPALLANEIRAFFREVGRA